jgi:hypothetical protein
VRLTLLAARRLLVALLGTVAVLGAGCPLAFADETVQACGVSYGAGVFIGSAAADMSAIVKCPVVNLSQGGLEVSSGAGSSARGDTARFQANAPAGLLIVGAGVPSMIAYNMNSAGAAFGGGFYWQGGGQEVTSGQSAALMSGFKSPYFGFQVICGPGNTCPYAPAGELQVNDILLGVSETVAPSLTAPTGLWQAAGWVRASWPFFAWGDSPSGLCSLSASLNGALINKTTSGQDVSTWHQCAAPAIDQSVDTSQYGQGPLPLTLSASDAAGVPASTTKTVNVDNQQPTVTLSGPTDAPSTAGTQIVTATAAAGPSGVAGISCAVDDAPAQWYPSSTAQVPVSGVGEHTVDCSSANNAVDGAGNHGWSTTQSWSLKIGIPTISGIGFSTIVNALRCQRVNQQSEVPAKWVTVRQHRKLVRVRRLAHRETVKITRCHPRTESKQITVRTTVRRHGKKIPVTQHKTVRVILLPHAASRATRLVPYGHQTTVSGWLGTTNGTALAGQTVSVITAPRQRAGTVHACRSRHHRGRRQLDVDASRRPLPTGRSHLRRRANNRSSRLSTRPRRRASQRQIAQRLPETGRLGRHRSHHRPARRRLPTARRRPAATTDRNRLHVLHLRDPRARHRKRKLLDQIHPRRWRPQLSPFDLVSSRITADGRRLPVRARREPTTVRPSRRPPSPPPLLPLSLVSNMKRSLER